MDRQRFLCAGAERKLGLLWPAVRGEVTTGGKQRRASMPLADSASGSGESHANVSVPPPNAQGDSKAATLLAIDICAKCWPCCRGAASEREWPSSPLPVASASPTEDLLLSMTSKLSARSSAVEPGSRPSGAKVASGTNGPESALCDDQSSDQGWSSGDPLHALETAVPQSRNSPAGIFRGTHARGTIHERGGGLARRPTFWPPTLASGTLHLYECACPLCRFQKKATIPKRPDRTPKVVRYVPPKRDPTRFCTLHMYPAPVRLPPSSLYLPSLHPAPSTLAGTATAAKEAR